MSWKIRWEELDGDDVRGKERKKKRSSRKTDVVFGATEQSEALLRSNSKMSMNSDKVW